MARSLQSTTILVLLVIAGGGCGGGGGGSSGQQANPVPLLASVFPSELAAGAPETTITLAGENFIPSSQAIANGTPLETIYVSAGQLCRCTG